MTLAVRDSLAFDSVHGTFPNIIHVSGAVYAIAYSRLNAPRPGYLKTVSVDNDGNIGSVIDTLEFDPGGGLIPCILHISGDIYAIVYRGPGTDGWLVTVKIDNAGNITAPIVDSYEFDAATGYSPHIIHIAGTVYAIAYAGPGDDGWLRTLTIANDGTIAVAPEIANLEFDTGYGIPGGIIHISGDIYAIAYVGYDAVTKYDVRIATVDIDNMGNIAGAVIDRLQILPPCSPTLSAVGVRRIVHVAGNVYALAYCSMNAALTQKIFLFTFDIDAAGNIGAAPIDSMEVETGWNAPTLFKLSAGIHAGQYAVAYTGLHSDGFLKTIIIEAAGAIGAVTNTLEFDTDRCGPRPSLLNNALGIIAIAYEGPGNDGFIKTIGVLSTVTTQAMDNIAATTADGHGNVTDLGIPNPTQHGHCWDTSPNPTIWDSKTELGAVGATGPFTSALTGLTCATTYYVRAYAYNGMTTVYGAEVSFTTAIGLPIVATNPETGLGLILATFNGTLDDDGGEVCACGFEWGADIAYGLTTPTESKTIGETFSQQILGLFPGTEYHYRAFATNSAGTAYGADRSFRSKPGVGRAYALSRQEL